MITVCSSFSLKFDHVSHCIVTSRMWGNFQVFCGYSKYKQVEVYTKLLKCCIRPQSMAKDVYKIRASLFLSENHGCIFPIRYEMYPLCKFSLYLFYKLFTMHLSLQKVNKQLQINN